MALTILSRFDLSLAVTILFSFMEREIEEEQEEEEEEEGVICSIENMTSLNFVPNRTLQSIQCQFSVDNVLGSRTALCLCLTTQSQRRALDSQCPQQRMLRSLDLAF